MEQTENFGGGGACALGAPLVPTPMYGAKAYKTDKQHLIES